jgi:dolichol-phosphate mannosyltransferase
VTAGLDYAAGDAVVIIDADLQDPPEVIVEMLAKWREGYKVVYGVRAKRAGESRFKLWTAAIFYRLLQRLSDTKMPLDTGDFRLIDRQVVEVIRTMREGTRYLRGLISWVGFRQYGLAYNRDRRFAGQTHYPFGRMLKLALDGLTNFSEKPLFLAGYFGAGITALAVLMIIWMVINKLYHPETLVTGWTSLLVAILFLGGIQLLSLGLLGQYIGRIFRESKGRPLYIIGGVYGRAGAAGGPPR